MIPKFLSIITTDTRWERDTFDRCAISQNRLLGNYLDNRMYRWALQWLSARVQCLQFAPLSADEPEYTRPNPLPATPKRSVRARADRSGKETFSPRKTYE